MASMENRCKPMLNVRSNVVLSALEERLLIGARPNPPQGRIWCAGSASTAQSYYATLQDCRDVNTFRIGVVCVYREMD
jgi:hypothetical protein